MSLSEKLQQIAEKAKERIPEESRKKMQRATEELRKSGLAEQAAGEGDSLPAFEMPNQDGKMMSSADLLASGPLVLSFYRGAW